MERTAATFIFARILIISVLVQPFFAGCATQSVRTYEEINAKTISAGSASRSNDRIDQYTTYMIYFKLEKKVDSMRISVAAEYIADILGTRRRRNSFFVVEKTVDVRQFKKQEAEYVYAEIGNNYTADWKSEKDITVVSEKGNPFKDLEGGSTYRIRFTTFTSDDFEFTINIEADCKVTYFDRME
jgi:hypothetical protein